MHLDDVLSTDNEYYLLDEPEQYLNNDFISYKILDKLKHLQTNKKTIIFTTHNNILGINSKPSQYIFRDTTIDNVTKCNETYYGTLADKYLFSYSNKDVKLNIQEKILKYFEGNKEHYKYRMSIYGIKGEKNE